MKPLLSLFLIALLLSCNDGGVDTGDDPCAGVPKPCPEKKGLIDSTLTDTLIINEK